jgi:hypothetical protein
MSFEFENFNICINHLIQLRIINIILNVKTKHFYYILKISKTFDIVLNIY